MTTLYLIRHGETLWNADGRFQGQQNSPLTAHGLRQAQLAAEALSALPLEAIYTSDLDRAALTADTIAQPHRLTPVRDARLREASFGAWEGLTLPEIGARWPEMLAAWREDSLRTRPPGGETLEQVHARVIEAARDIVARHPAGAVAIVGHGGSMRAVVALALGATLSIFRRIRLDNCSLTTVKAQQGEFSLITLNDICHLAAQTPHSTWDEAGNQWRMALNSR